MIATKPTSPAKPVAGRRWTFEEMLAELPERTQPAELWDGELVMAPAPSYFHQRVNFRFHQLLDEWVTRHKLGETAGAPVDMVLTSRRVTQPDVVFIARERLNIIGEQINGPADLVAEVVSPSTRRRDRIDKRDLYEQHGVKEYWLIDPDAQTVEVLHLEKGEYKLAGRWRPGETAKSKLLKGFGVEVAGLLAAS